MRRYKKILTKAEFRQNKAFDVNAKEIAKEIDGTIYLNSKYKYAGDVFIHFGLNGIIVKKFYQKD